VCLVSFDLKSFPPGIKFFKVENIFWSILKSLLLNEKLCSPKDSKKSAPWRNTIKLELSETMTCGIISNCISHARSDLIFTIHAQICLELKNQVSCIIYCNENCYKNKIVNCNVCNQIEKINFITEKTLTFSWKNNLKIPNG